MQMTTTTPTPISTAYQQNTEPQVNTGYQSALTESKQPLPFSSESIGVTAEQSLASQPMPKTIADFNARGGISSTYKNTYNNLVAQKRQKEVQKNYEKLLLGGEQAADAAYNDFVKAYGDEIKGWIPPKDLFYDDKTGAFLPHKYYESMYVGKQKFLENKSGESKAQLEKDKGQLEKDKFQVEKDKIQSPIDANKGFADTMNKPDITQSQAYGEALKNGTVTPEMEKGIATLKNPNKADKTKDDIAWAKLKVQQGSQRLREMQILLTQEKGRGDANQKAMEKITDAKKDLREVQARQKEIQQMYNRALNGTPVMDKDGNMLDASDLSDMLHNAEMTSNDVEQNIASLESLRKSRVLSPIHQKVIEKTADVIGADQPSGVSSSPTPMTSVPGYTAPTRKPLSNFMR
jgi:hypothetical protein